MASSDDEVDSLPESVTTYYFIDDRELPVSFAELPIQWTKTETGSDHNDNNIQTLKLFLKGIVDNGLRTIYKQVVAWKFDLSCAIPRISVLTKEKNWMELEKPRKSYEEIIRTVMITLHCLHFVRRNKEVSAKSVWDYLGKTFSSFERRPSQNDLVDHIGLIRAAVKRDNSLSNCKFLLNFLEEKPRKKMLPDEDVQSAFIDDDEDSSIFEDVDEDEFNDDDELFDSVCAFCDNGGDLLCCEGSCLRSFHATKEAGEDSFCDSLGYTHREVETMKNFFCKNCKYNQHQCFSCGKLGSSDKFSSAEVFRCANATCGFFYHPHCVAKLLHWEDKVAAEELQKRIAAGESFACPMHKCSVCKQVENKKETELQFAVCRRCPTSYHRKCLPKEILFEGQEDDDTIARAWEDLLPNRILIYCLKHDIIDHIGTPSRAHIRFPDVGEKKTAIELKKRRQTSEFPTNEENIVLKKSRLTSGESFSGNLLSKASKELPAAVKKVKITNKSGIASELDSPRKTRADDASGKSFRENTKSALTEMERSATANLNKTSLGNQLYELMKKTTGQPKGVKQNIAGTELDKLSAVKSVSKKLTNELPPLDADTERRLQALMKEAACSITLEDVIKKHKVPSTHAYSSKHVVDKTITLGKVEATVEAIRTAVKKLEENCSIEDAKAVCEPGALHQLYKWKSKLNVFLAPFLHGMRYTSFGRHFTKVEKLVEIVDILHLYVEPGDMIVDFCCGANDFSCLMKKKLEETGKKCSYKNYDVIQPKHDFNFEKRDWMTVRPQELPKRGSQLIMGLNPPFGIKAALANKFIDKALEFKPKLLILIVPAETERLDKKKPPYDLVWEDCRFLSGKSFYLPGSVDEHDKQMDQWNVTPPPLYLWSRHDWSSKHKAIAQKHGHPYRQQRGSNLEKDIGESEIHDHPVEDQYHNGDALKLTNDIFMQNIRPDALIPTDDTSMQKKRLGQKNHNMVSDKGHEGRSPYNQCDKESEDSYGLGTSHSSETSRKTRQGQEKAEKVTGEKSLEGRLNYEKKPSVRGAYKGVPRPSPPNIDSRFSVENPSRSFEKSVRAVMGQNCLQYLEPGISGSFRLQHGTTYGGAWAGVPDDLSSGYSMNNDESYLHEVDGFFAGGNMEEQLTRHVRDGIPSMGYRSSVTELQREAGIHSKVHLHGQDPGFIQGNYLGGHDLRYGQMGSTSSNPYGHLGLAQESSYPMSNMSTMQRYAPRLDELNHTRMSNFPPQSSMLNGNGIYDPRTPGPGYQADPMGFAPGPRFPYPHQSAGWLND